MNHGKYEYVVCIDSENDIVDNLHELLKVGKTTLNKVSTQFNTIMTNLRMPKHRNKSRQKSINEQMTH